MLSLCGKHPKSTTLFLLLTFALTTFHPALAVPSVDPGVTVTPTGAITIVGRAFNKCFATMTRTYGIVATDCDILDKAQEWKFKPFGSSYQIVASKGRLGETEQCMKVLNNAKRTGIPMIYVPCNSNDMFQLFKVEALPGGGLNEYRVLPAWSTDGKMCIQPGETRGFSPNNSILTRLQQEACEDENVDPQQGVWTIEAELSPATGEKIALAPKREVQLISKLTNTCVEMRKGHKINGVRAVISSCDEDAHEIFSFENFLDEAGASITNIVAMHAREKCLWARPNTVGGRVAQHPCRYIQKNQQWEIIQNESDPKYFSISHRGSRSRSSSLCMAVDGSQQVVLMACNHSDDAQLWTREIIKTNFEQLERDVATFKRNAPPDVSKFNLASGYDIIRGAGGPNTDKGTCLDVTHQEFKYVETPAYETTGEGTQVRDHHHLAQLLDVSESARIGILDTGLDVSLSEESKRYSESVLDESHVTIVGKVKTRLVQLKIHQTPVEQLHYTTRSLLSPNSFEAMNEFRNTCGDQFVERVDLGSALYVVFSFDARKFSTVERDSYAANAEGLVDDLFSFGFSESRAQELKELSDLLCLEFKVHQVGGVQGYEDTFVNVNFWDFNSKLLEFRSLTNSSNWAPLDYAYRDYRIPTEFVSQGYTFEEIYLHAAHGGPAAPYFQFLRYLDLSVQLKQRCDLWSTYGRTRPTECGTAATAMVAAVNQCTRSRSWEHCKHPEDYQFRGDTMLSYLNEEIKVLEPAIHSEAYDWHVHKGDRWVSDETCLGGDPNDEKAAKNCFLVTSQGQGQCRVRLPGYDYHTNLYDNPKGNSRSVRIERGHCIRSSVHLETWIFDSTADWEYRITARGMCAQEKPFSAFGV